MCVREREKESENVLERERERENVLEREREREKGRHTPKRLFSATSLARQTIEPMQR